MTSSTNTDTGTAPQPYTDTFGIGQAACARNRCDIARREMAKCAADILTTSYVPPEWVAMQVRLFRMFLAQAERAEGVLDA